MRIDTSTLKVVVIKNEKNDEVQVLRLTSKMGETVKCIFWWSTCRTLKVIIWYIGAQVKTSLKATTKIGAYSNSTNPKGITWKPKRVLLHNFQWTIYYIKSFTTHQELINSKFSRRTYGISKFREFTTNCLANIPQKCQFSLTWLRSNNNF